MAGRNLQSGIWFLFFPAGYSSVPGAFTGLTAFVRLLLFFCRIFFR
jgi:hypothetical protein